MSLELAQKMEEQARALRAAANSEPAPIPTFHHPGATPATPAHLQLLVQQEVARQIAAMPRQAPPAPRQGHIEEALMTLLQQSLKPAEFAWIQEHIADGAKGFVEFLQSGTIKEVARLAFSEYKEFLGGQRN